MTCAVIAGLTLLLALAWIAAWPLLGRLDNRLEEAPMSLRDHIRRYFGTLAISNHLANLEETMATALEQLTELRAAVTDMNSDLTAKLDQLAAAQGEFTPEAQQVFDDIKQTVAAADAKVGDADGSDAPAEPVPGDEVR